MPNRVMLRLYQRLLAAGLFTAYPTGRAARFFALSIKPCTICRIIPRKRTISIVRIRILVPIKCAALLKVTPPSLKKIMALIVQWTIRNTIRNRPVAPITILRPIEDVKNALNQFISYSLLVCKCIIWTLKYECITLFFVHMPC